jgi:two-component system chemotaxis response regulator CheB
MTLRVLVAEDSPIFAEAIVQILSADPDLEVVGVAADGEQAVEMTASLRPNVITMDVLMPKLDGLSAIDQIMRRCPTPVLVLTADPRGQSGRLGFEALQRGAVDVMLKPERFPCPEDVARRLCDRVHVVAGVPRRRGRKAPVAPRARPRRGNPIDVVGIAASTGGPAVLGELLIGLPASTAATIAVVQHLPPGFVDGFVRWIAERSSLPVAVARHGERLRPGEIWIAPDGHHLELGETRLMLVEGRGLVSGHEPSGDVLLESIARHHGPRGAGIVLTGMGSDGAAGLGAVRAAGGMTVAQERDSCVVYGMPRAAAERGAAQELLSVDGIRRFLANLPRAASRADDAPPSAGSGGATRGT